MVLDLAISRQKNLSIEAKFENCFGVNGVLKKWDRHLATPFNQEEFW